MAMGVIEGLEMIKIQHDQGKKITALATGANQFVQALLEQSAVGQFGEGIVESQPMHLGLMPFALGKILHRPGKSTWRAIQKASHGATDQDGKVAAIVAAQSQLAFQGLITTAEQLFVEPIKPLQIARVDAVTPEIGIHLLGRLAIAKHLLPTGREKAGATGEIEIPPAIVSPLQNGLQSLFGGLELVHLALNQLPIAEMVDVGGKLLGQQTQHLQAFLPDRFSHARQAAGVGR